MLYDVEEPEGGLRSMRPGIGGRLLRGQGMLCERPRIGLTMRIEMERERFYLGRDYCEAVEAAGGIPVHLGLIPKAEYIEGALEGLDGILLPGSDSDVDPARP